MVVDLTVQEQAPVLQARQQEHVIGRLGVAQAAVEAVDGPELRHVPEHHKLHLQDQSF